jgi:hypothetical protein
VEPINTLLLAGRILFAGILFGLFIPGVLYYFTGTFSSTNVANKLPANEKLLWEAHENNVKDLKESVRLLDARIADLALHGSPAKDVSALVEERSKLYSLLQAVKGQLPFHLNGFYLGTLMFVWPIFYICISWLVFLFSPKYPFRWKLRSRLLLFGGTFVLYRWPTWVRNLYFLRNIERHVYVNGNWDISIPSFFVQESQAALACVLLVGLWIKWADFFPIWRAHVRNNLLIRNAEEKQTAEFGKQLLALFVHWQLCSVILAGAFVPYTYFFWNYVIDYGDKRYLAHALIMHGLWGVTWLLISLPLVWTWYEWNLRYRLGAGIAHRRGSPNDADEFKVDVGSVVGSWNVVGSLVGAALTFGFPLIKEILTHV